MASSDEGAPREHQSVPAAGQERVEVPAILPVLAVRDLVVFPGVTVPLARRTAAHGWCLDGGPEVPDDDRAEVQTIRVGVGPRVPMLKPDHITPSKTIGLAQRFLIAPEHERRALFSLGYADAARYWGRPTEKSA